jgi:hypothetical protein
LDLAVAGLNSSDVAAIRAWIGCGLAIGAAMLSRPDGGLLLASVEVYLAVLFLQRIRKQSAQRELLRAAVIVVFAALAPLLPWTVRNFRTLHAFEPLAPRYANEKGAFVPMGFNRWTKTWIADYASVEEVYWAATSSPIDPDNLPTRAFDTPEQQDQTEELIDDYNRVLHVTPELDSRFAALAAERIHHAPLRYYVWLPVVRIADMWLRPRTEILPCNTRWWEFDEEKKWLVLSLTLGVVNLLYVGGAVLGLIRGRFPSHVAVLLTFVFLRSAFLGTLENPEPRYTLECYPVVILFAAALLSGNRDVAGI